MSEPAESIQLTVQRRSTFSAMFSAWEPEGTPAGGIFAPLGTVSRGKV